MSSNNQQSDPEYIRHDFLVDANQSKLRVDKFIADRIAKISRNKIQDAINGGLVRVNEKLVKANFKVKPGDKVQVLSFEEPEEFHVEPENIPINIIYEDEYRGNQSIGVMVTGSTNIHGSNVNIKNIQSKTGKNYKIKLFGENKNININ